MNIKKFEHQSPNRRKSTMMKRSTKVSTGSSDYTTSSKNSKRSPQKRRVRKAINNYNDDAQKQYLQILGELLEYDSPTLILYLQNIDLRHLINNIRFEDLIPHYFIQLLLKVAQENGDFARKIRGYFMESNFFPKIKSDFLLRKLAPQNEEEIQDLNLALYQLITAIDLIMEQFPDNVNLYPLQEIHEAVLLTNNIANSNDITLPISKNELLDKMRGILNLKKHLLEMCKKKYFQPTASTLRTDEDHITDEDILNIEVQSKFSMNYYLSDAFPKKSTMDTIEEGDKLRKSENSIAPTSKIFIEHLLHDIQQSNQRLNEGKGIKLHQLQLDNFFIDSDGLQFEFKLNKSDFEISEDLIKQMYPGNMVILSTDGFKTQFFCILMKRDLPMMAYTYQKHDYITINLQIFQTSIACYNLDDFFKTNKAKPFEMLMLNKYFGASQPVIEKLQMMRKWFQIPLQSYFLKQESAHSSYPKYISYLSEAQKFKIQSLIEGLRLDEEMEMALKYCILNEVALVQGFYGSGKTYLLQQLLSILITIKNTWKNKGPILVLTNSNKRIVILLKMIKKITDSVVSLSLIPNQEALYKYILFEKQRLSDKVEKLTSKHRMALDQKEKMFHQTKQVFIIKEFGIITSQLESPFANELLNTIEMDFILEIK